MFAATLATGLAALGTGAGVTHVRAAQVQTCEGDTSWTIANSLTPSTVSGEMTVNAGECANVDTAGLPFEPLSTDVASGTNPYTYQGTCAEGFIAFSNGDVAIFMSGIVVWERQIAGAAYVVTGALLPPATPCGGAPNSTMTWSGVLAEAGS